MHVHLLQVVTCALLVGVGSLGLLSLSLPERKATDAILDQRFVQPQLLVTRTPWYFMRFRHSSSVPSMTTITDD